MSDYLFSDEEVSDSGNHNEPQDHGHADGTVVAEEDEDAFIEVSEEEHSDARPAVMRTPKTAT